MCNDKVKYKDGFFIGKDDLEIYFKQYEVENSEAVVVISHGFCETIEKYTEFIQNLNENKFSVYAIEHRGHGNSGRLGRDNSQIYVNKFEDYIEDLKEFLDRKVVEELKGRKLLLYAHSMGGAIGALFLQTYSNYFDAAILNCPMMEINTGKYPQKLSKIIVKGACIIGKDKSYILGHGPFEPTPNIESSGTSCKNRYESYFNKQLQYRQYQTSGASYRWLNEAFKAAESVIKKENIEKIKIPILLFQVQNDAFVCEGGQNIFASHCNDCKLVIKENAKHELYIEKDEILNPYMEEVIEFYKSQI